MDKQERFMEMAEACAKEALAAEEVPVGCVVVRGGDVVSSGFNRTNMERNPLAHAEFVAVRTLCGGEEPPPFPLHELTVYVTCEPCIMCMSLLIKLGIRRVVYGCRNERFGGRTVFDVQKVLCSEGGRSQGRNKPLFELVGGVREEHAIALLKDFYRSENVRAPADKRKTKPPRPGARSNQ